MTKTLTQADIKELRYQCRMGYILPFLLFIIATVPTVISFEAHASFNLTRHQASLLIVFSFLALAILISYSMNRKYYQDIRNNRKISEIKTIQRKTSKRDFEAGSGNWTTLPHNNPMNEFIRYDLIVDNTIYRVEKELFESCSDGDNVSFYYAPKSKYLLTIEKE